MKTGVSLKYFLNDCKVPNDTLRNLPFCFFASLLIVSLTPFINKLVFSRDLTIFMMSSLSWFQVINLVCFVKSKGRRNPKIFF